MSKSIRVTYTKDGKECAVFVKKPTHSQLTEANLYAAAVFNKARKTGVCLRSQIDDWLEEQGIWTKDDRAKIKELDASINEKLEILKTGKDKEGKNLKLSEARKIALDTKVERWQFNIFQLKRREYDQYSVEGQTENARFDCLASLCILDEEGNRLFKSVDDYYDSGEEPHINEAASKLANIMFGNDEWEKSLEENKFLAKHGLVNDDGRLINKDGKFVNFAGELVVEDEVKVEIEPVFEDDTQ